MKSTWKWEAMMSFLSLSLIEFSFFAANTSCVLPWWFVGAEGKGWNCPLASEDYRKSTDNGTKLNSWPQSLPNILSTGHETLLKTAAVFFTCHHLTPCLVGKGRAGGLLYTLVIVVFHSAPKGGKQHFFLKLEFEVQYWLLLSWDILKWTNH